jgi:hypothetical protein
MTQPRRTIMADTKISELTTATSPLAGSEVLPIVQSNTTKKVSVDNLTTGKNVPCSSLTSSGKVYASQAAGTGGFNLGTRDNGSSVFEFYSASGNLQLYSYSEVADVLTYTSGSGLTLNTGNLIIGTSGKGIDFSATSGTGTSELFSDYEEGSYTATILPETSGSITLDSSVNTLTYTKIGRVVTVTGMLQVDSVASPVGNYVAINLPFTISNIGPYASRVGSSAVSSQPGYSNKVLLGVENTSQFRMYIDASTISGGNQFSFSFNFVAA